jgi:hypothetical protein
LAWAARRTRQCGAPRNGDRQELLAQIGKIPIGLSETDR